MLGIELLVWSLFVKHLYFVENHWHFKLVLEMYVVMEEKIQQISPLKV